MRANEFVKKFGWEHSKYIAEKWYNPHKSFDTKTYHTTYYRDNSGETSLVELKRLVESYELVRNFGGIKRAKRILKKAYTQFNTMVSVVWNDQPFQCTIQQLEQSIADVESCQ